MARVIVITSGKGGVGKTTLTASLGRALASMSLKVVMLDTDIGLNNLDVLLNVENKITYDLTDIIQNRCRVKQALIEDTEVKGLFILPSAHGYDNGNISGQNIKAVILSLRQTFDYILIDSPAGIEAGFHRAVSAADEAIVVTTQHLSAIRDANKVVEILKSYSLNDMSFILNRVRGDLEYSGEAVSIADVASILRIRALGTVPEDDSINMMSTSISQIKECDGKNAICLIAKNLHYGTNDIYDCTKKYKGFFGGLKRRAKKYI